MPWLEDEEMADLHVIRQDYAQALNAWQADRTAANGRAVDEQDARRARAIRSLHRDDNATVRQLAAMFRCSKAVIRAALEAKED